MPPGRGPVPGAAGRISGRPAWLSGGCGGICGDWLWPQAWKRVGSLLSTRELWLGFEPGVGGGVGLTDGTPGCPVRSAGEARGMRPRGTRRGCSSQQRELTASGCPSGGVLVGPHASQA